MRSFCFTISFCWIFLFIVVVFLLLIIFVMVRAAFLTLLESKVLGYVHIRKGPNKVGFVGIFQPFRDAIMLFTREQYFTLFSNDRIFSHLICTFFTVSES